MLKFTNIMGREIKKNVGESANEVASRPRTFGERWRRRVQMQRDGLIPTRFSSEASSWIDGSKYTQTSFVDIFPKREVIQKEVLPILPPQEPTIQPPLSQLTLQEGMRNYVRIRISSPTTSPKETIDFKKNEYDERQITLQEAVTTALLGIDEDISSQERRILDSITENKSNREIMEEQQVTRFMLDSALARIRRVAEDRFAEQHIFRMDHFKQIVGESYDKLRDAATIKSLPAVLFARMYYTTLENIQWKLDNTLRRIPSDLQGYGLVPIRSALSSSEYDYVKRKEIFHDYLFDINGVFYMLEADRDAVLSLLYPPTIDYRPLRHFAPSDKERDYLWRAINKGKLTAVKKKNEWMTTQEALDEFRKQYEPEP